MKDEPSGPNLRFRPFGLELMAERDHSDIRPEDSVPRDSRNSNELIVG